jgi:hypothetical protein
MLESKEAIISHLSWVTFSFPYIRFIYLHNDTVLPTTGKQILFEPLFAVLHCSFRFMNLMFYYQIQLVQQQ